MDLKDAIKKRRSVREFDDKQIPDEILKEILELANLSPSAGNLQARSVIILKDKKEIEKIPQTSLYNQTWIKSASIVLIILANEDESSLKYGDRGNFYALQDATIFTSYVQLLAVDYGLSSRWVGAFDEKQVQSFFNIPKGKRPVVILPIGYSKQIPKERERKNLKEIVLKEI